MTSRTQSRTFTVRSQGGPSELSVVRVGQRRATRRLAGTVSMCSGRSRICEASQGWVQPTKSKRRAMMPAVKPHRMRSLSSPIRKAGPFQPEGWRTEIRCWGSSSSSIGSRSTACTSRGSTTPTGLSSRHQASTGVTAKLLGGSHSSGSDANTSTPDGSTPVSSSASQRGRGGGGVLLVDGAAREGDLPGVGAHVVGALGEQQVGTGRTVAEEHEDGAAAGVGPLGRDEPGQLLDGDVHGSAPDRLQPIREGGCAGRSPGGIGARSDTRPSLPRGPTLNLRPTRRGAPRRGPRAGRRSGPRHTPRASPHRPRPRRPPPAARAP